MNLKSLMIGLMSGVALLACGGTPEEFEQPAEQAAVAEPSAVMVAVEAVGNPMSGTGEDGRLTAMWTANCAGWDSGARTCSWKCRSSSEWLWATQSVAYGQCGAYAADFCGSTAYKTCWSSNKP
ncbi:hypothetical protein [Hyalangium rubrum]|uniref:Lipoprotein n=1 Tax=Hyalangium rubrum TaxID=3103134 RepID=A0ABU5H3L6_9BACT|nr:hypothetical protein [Hyalangium sp. s54d21]MDY7227382.1 hypothetical protein [Hyalangium sp. s54d21]